MSHPFSSPDHPSRRRNVPLDVAFDRIVGRDRLLGGLAVRHWLHGDLRTTFVAVLGPPMAWLLSGRVLGAGVAAIAFGGLLVLCLWTAAEHGLAQAGRLLTAVRWVAVAITFIGLLVCWNGGSGGNPGPQSAPHRVPSVAPFSGHYRTASQP
jgi:hypothetical protein